MSEKEGMVNNYCLNQPAIVERVFNTVKEYELGFEPSDEPLIEVRIREGLYLNVSWLRYPYIDYEGRIYKLAEFLEEAEESYKVELVKDILENWYKQFSQLCSDKVKGGWAVNYNALSVIWYAIQNGEEFNVYVPMFDTNFTNETAEEGGTVVEQSCASVDAFVEFISQALDCYEYIADNDKSANDIVSKLNDEHSLYMGATEAIGLDCPNPAAVKRTDFTVAEKDLPAGVVTNEDYAPNIRRMLERDYSGEKCVAVPSTAELFKQVSQLVRYIGLDGKRHNEPVRVCSLKELATTADHDIALISGGNNGSPDWNKYLSDIQDILQVLEKDGFDTWIIQLTNDCLDDVHYTYIGLRKPRPVCNETSADIDRELTEDERKQAIKKLEKVRADLKRRAEESVVYYDNDRVQQKLAAKMAADNVMRKAAQLKARTPDKHVLTATRKLKDCLKALKKYHLPQHSLDVDGWVVRLHLVSSYIDNGKANYKYMINLPWLDYELSISAFGDYVAAKKDKKCPVAWEYLYLINQTLQEL